MPTGRRPDDKEHGGGGSAGSSGTVQSLDRAVRLLDVLAQADGLTLTGAAEAAGMPPSTAHRILNTLEHHGLVRHDPDRALWLIGVRAFQIGNAFLRNRKVAEVARPYMRELMARCGETVSLSVEDENSAVFVAQIESHAPIRAFHRPGTRTTMHASAAGKVLLSGRNAAALKAFCETGALVGHTSRTLSDETSLLSEIANVRAQGWAVDREERVAGMCCVASPICNEHGEIVAAISVSGPVSRMADDRLRELGELVCASAEDVTRAFGGMALAA